MIVVVTLLTVRGSTPRDAGTQMAVGSQTQRGTIGGGALELACVEHARALLSGRSSVTERRFALGPGLGQCCGGAVTVGFERRAGSLEDFSIPQPKLPELAPPLQRDRAPLWLWGAGHVGRAMVNVLAPLGAFEVTWIDSAPDRFPDDIPNGVTAVPAADMPRLAARAPRAAHHLIFTYSHDIDLALCHALLRRGFASCGLIGSATKWARFRSRLSALGLNPDTITCPIGDPHLGKHPMAIATGTARALLNETNVTGERGRPAMTPTETMPS